MNSYSMSLTIKIYYRFNIQRHKIQLKLDLNKKLDLVNTNKTLSQKQTIQGSSQKNNSHLHQYKKCTKFHFKVTNNNAEPAS